MERDSKSLEAQAGTGDAGEPGAREPGAGSPGTGEPDAAETGRGPAARRKADHRELIERVPAIVYTAELGEAGRWRYVSPQVKDILGYEAKEWERDPHLWARLIHPDDRQRVLAHEGESMAERRHEPIDYRMIARGGEVVWILDQAVLEEDEDGVLVWHGVLYDISARKAAEQELERSAAQQAVVAQLGVRALQEDGDPDALMRAAVSLVARIDGVEGTCIWGIDEETGELVLRAGLDEQHAGYAEAARAGRGSHARAALESGLHVTVDDWRGERRFQMPQILRPAGIRSSLAVAITGNRGPFGVLDIHSTRPSRFTPQDVHFAQAASNVLADALERQAAARELRHRVLHDSLTGLPNRLSFADSLGDAMRRATLTGAPVGLLFLDIDHFKLINDSMGHHAGDELLRMIAPRLREHLRPTDIVARFGGDEFGVLIDDLSDEEEAIAIADRVAAAFSEPYVLEGVEHFITASIGIAVSHPEDEAPTDPESLIRDADAAMYRAKERGRARRQGPFDSEMRARAVRRLEIERELRHARSRDELVLYYQPVVGLADGRIAGLEALVRWQNPKRGLMEPDDFIPIAEDSGLIGTIGSWVQDEACRQLLAWHEHVPDGRRLEVALNLSARQVAHRDLPSTIAAVLERTGLDPRSLRLEITESVLVEESATATATLAALAGLGVRLVLDDFGTGYSSLAYLNRFPFDALKIDRSFVDALGVERERSAIIEAIIGMANALSLDVIAEGVENEAQLRELRVLGCDYAQGYLFSPPVPQQDVTEMLRGGGYSGIRPGR